MQFDASVYSLNTLQSAAYRCLGDVSCNIISGDKFHTCSLIPKVSNSDLDVLKARFIDTANDESLREKLNTETEPVRNLLLSLAFSALAQKQ